MKTRGGQAQTKESQAGMTPAKALETLKEGPARFLEGKRKTRDLNAEVVATAAGHPARVRRPAVYSPVSVGR